MEAQIFSAHRVGGEHQVQHEKALQIDLPETL